MEIQERSARSGAGRWGPVLRRPGVLVGGLLLLALAVWSGVQVRRSGDREQQLRAELKQVYQEAEALRAVAVQWQERAGLLEQRMGALAAERERLTKRVRELERRLGEPREPRGSGTRSWP